MMVHKGLITSDDQGRSGNKDALKPVFHLLTELLYSGGVITLYDLYSPHSDINQSL